MLFDFICLMTISSYNYYIILICLLSLNAKRRTIIAWFIHLRVARINFRQIGPHSREGTRALPFQTIYSRGQVDPIFQ